MTTSNTPNPFESTNTDTHLNKRIEEFKTKLYHLAVKDSTGQALGIVKDVFLHPNGQMNLVINSESLGEERQFLISTNYIDKIDYQQKSLFLKITRDLVEKLPETSPQSLIENLASETPAAPIVYEQSIPLLEERLVVDRKKQKIGEVIVRKEIETIMVQVPVRREKLIVEQISPEHKQLAEIHLKEDHPITGIEMQEVRDSEQEVVIEGEFISAQVAANVLQAIAAQEPTTNHRVKIKIVLQDSAMQATYQQWFAQYSRSL